MECKKKKKKILGWGYTYAAANPQQYLDGGGAALLIPALTKQAVGFHIVARHGHGLHHMQAVAATQMDRADEGPTTLRSSKQAAGC